MWKNTKKKKELIDFIVDQCKNVDEKAVDLISKGKFYRPLLADFLSEGRTPMPVLAALELLHNASIFHDDVLDNETMRRGEMSPNLRYGNKLAVLNGDLLLSKSLSLVARNHESSILNYFSKALERLCEGEMEHQRLSRNKNVKLFKYFEVIKNKTGALFALSAFCGIYYSSQKNISYEIARVFEDLGALFQCRDDLKDYYEGPGQASDLAEDYVTFPVAVLGEEYDLGAYFLLSKDEKLMLLRKKNIYAKCESFIHDEHDDLYERLIKFKLNSNLFEVLNEFIY